MALMPGLQINMGQQLKLTPQLQQSIKILQYSAMEVQQTIETTLETNFMLEVDEELDQLDSGKQDQESEKDDQPVTSVEETPLEIEKNESIRDDIGIDMEWNEVYGDHNSSISSSPQAQGNDEYVGAENYTASSISLHDHLYWQSDIYAWDEHEDVIASYIIDDINDEGYLTSSTLEISESIAASEDAFSINENAVRSSSNSIVYLGDEIASGTRILKLSKSIMTDIKSLLMPSLLNEISILRVLVFSSEFRA